MTIREDQARLRKALKKHCRTLSVRGGRGTARAWLEISGSLEWGNFTDIERETLRSLGFNPGANFSVIDPDSFDYWLKKLSA
jgi:hypothetical protein